MTPLEELFAQLDVVNCTSGEMKGFGLAGCRKDRDRVVTVEITPSNFFYEEKQTLAYIREQQQKGKIIILQGVISFVEEDTQPTIETLPGSNIDVVAGEVPKKYTLTFNNGIDFSEALRQLNSQGRYNIALYDVKGSKFLTKTKSGKVKGFGMGMFYASPYMGSDGAKSAKQTAKYQIIDITEEDRQVIITSDQLDYSPNELQDVNDITLNIEPIVAGSTITFKPLLLDRSHLVENLDVANLRLTVDGSPVVPTSVSYTTTPGKVVITVPTPLAAADVVTLQTHDATIGKNIILVEEILYKSQEETAIVSA